MNPQELQVEERGETAIVYDPTLEYAPQFYEPGRWHDGGVHLVHLAV
jgi:hypothetical protein